MSWQEVNFVKLLVSDIKCNTESIKQNLFYCFSTRSIESVNFSFKLETQIYNWRTRGLFQKFYFVRAVKLMA